MSMPVIIALILSIIYPRENLLFGRRLQYKNDDLEPSENAIKYTRIVSIVGLIFIGMVIVFFLT